LAIKTPMTSGIPSIRSIDENNNCKIIIKNCATYEVTLERDDILGIMEVEVEEVELIPLIDNFISSVCQDIHKHFPKVKKKRLSRQDTQKRCHLQLRDEYKEK
jgi:hypothetical protein